ncbi:MAG: Lrp/AsnC ligand binding domain-containing protein [Planctomycetota bacterium]|nr:Lrp/AsnC ligand binding domain-containing protein [Planctomycetota bacterium]
MPEPMDDLDKRILTAMQADLPVAARPFDALAERMDLAPGDLLARVRRMAEGGLIRRIGPVFDSQRLGYCSTLVAARVPPDRLEDVAERVNPLPGVTHNYERRGRYNLWFTLTARSPEDLETTLDRLRTDTGVAEMHSLPALARYKIRATFNLTDSGAASSAAPPAEHPGEQAAVPLNEEQRALVRALQDGLPVEAEPFAATAERAGRPVEEIIEQVREWLDEGVVRRFGAVVRHRAAGVRASAMAVFQVDAARIDAAGRTLAAHAEVTHCYRRPPLPDFPYTLYAMVHGESEEAVRKRVGEMAGQVAAQVWDALFSGREFKKTSMRYFLEGGAS